MQVPQPNASQWFSITIAVGQGSSEGARAGCQSAAPRAEDISTASGFLPEIRLGWLLLPSA